MAALSPVKSPASSVASAALSGSNSSKSLRGLNKPKCIKCGNVARSRCPYQSCKNCCAKAQNPCHIHVLKGNSSLPDKTPSSISPLFEQQSTELPLTGNSQRLRQLSNNFAQFSNLTTSNRARKPLTRKEALVINEWRFKKLKEFKEGKIEEENKAFDRYLQNVSLLEDIFSVNPEFDEQIEDGENVEKMVKIMKQKLQSNPVRAENLKKRIQFIVDQGLKDLKKPEFIDDSVELSETEEIETPSKKVKLSGQSERELGLSDFNDKLNKARNEEDLKAAQEMASQIFGWAENHKFESELDCFRQNWFRTVTTTDEAVSGLDAQFYALGEIENL